MGHHDHSRRAPRFSRMTGTSSTFRADRKKCRQLCRPRDGRRDTDPSTRTPFVGPRVGRRRARGDAPRGRVSVPPPRLVPRRTARGASKLGDPRARFRRLGTRRVVRGVVAFRVPGSGRAQPPPAPVSAPRDPGVHVQGGERGDEEGLRGVAGGRQAAHRGGAPGQGLPGGLGRRRRRRRAASVQLGALPRAVLGESASDEKTTRADVFFFSRDIFTHAQASDSRGGEREHVARQTQRRARVRDGGRRVPEARRPGAMAPLAAARRVAGSRRAVRGRRQRQHRRQK